MRQIDDSNKKKQYQSIMSEHERKVNESELIAYTNNESAVKAGAENGLRNVLRKNMNSEVPIAVKMNAADYLTGSKNVEAPLFVSPVKLVQMATKNMEDPDVSYMRSNTHNKSYGCYKRAVNGSVNKSYNDAVPQAEMCMPAVYESVPSERQMIVNKPFADAAKEQLKGPIKEHLANPSRGNSLEPPVKKLNNENPPFIPVGKTAPRELKAVGGARRQIANYNILTGKEIARNDKPYGNPGLFGPRNENIFVSH